jgi:type II secretory ATPase GspE/PulE/Tfp pilus assembly ATPase PilB-like protein
MLRDSVLINACIQQGLLSPELVSETQRKARREHKDLLTALAFAARIPVSTFYRAYAALHQLPFIAGKAIVPSAKLIRKLPHHLLERRLIIPMDPDDITPERIRLVVADPEDQAGLQQIKRIIGQSVDLYLAEPKMLAQIIRGTLRHATPFIASEDAQKNKPDEFDSVQTLNQIFDEAYLLQASDIHFEALKEAMQIRLRVDGRLQDFPRIFNKDEGQSLMSRLKVISGLDISEQRMPQDGSLRQTVDDGSEFDVRVATMPTRFGERATLRLLGSDTRALSLEQIGMSPQDLSRFRDAIAKPHGMILITGPTGSGKSTTLYSALQEIATDDINILTAEDPVEYVMEGISQVQVSSKVAFSAVLRSFLRHDPDVIMVGEIRDGETASIAMKAAMTGHLVFSTLHTNSAIAAVNRLVDIGAERYLIGSTLLAVIAQRLVRRLCPLCKVSHTASESQCQKIGVTYTTRHPLEIFHPKGCANCSGTGYKGRLALFETLWIDNDMAKLISQGADELTLQTEAKYFYSLAEDGRQKVIQGVTSIEELERLSLLAHFSNASPLAKEANRA